MCNRVPAYRLVAHHRMRDLVHVHRPPVHSEMVLCNRPARPVQHLVKVYAGRVRHVVVVAYSKLHRPDVRIVLERARRPFRASSISMNRLGASVDVGLWDISERVAALIHDTSQVNRGVEFVPCVPQNPHRLRLVLQIPEVRMLEGVYLYLRLVDLIQIELR